ncbi:MAG: TIGR03016 family PEP-CTERM system-associated outer membrane protein [Gammaproteobacteria bacterium]|nr:TIGR03016 family PEP-CTERM system-associated outer membrane protein [Gammaproteobacteria bacterium]
MSLKRISKLIHPTACSVLLAAGTCPAGAAWEATADVSVAETYTDNRCLSESDEKGEWITSLTPQAALQGESARASLSLQASVEMNSQNNKRGECSSSRFGDDGDNDRVNPRLSANGSLEVIRQMFFIDASASARQNAIDSFSSFSDSNLSARGNRNTTYSYSVSPYFVSRIKDFADVTLRASYSDQSNTARAVDDSARESANLSIQGVSGSRLSWGLNGNYSREDYNESQLLPGEENELASASATLGYQISRKWQVNATAGEDFNEFSTISNDIEGGFWDVGVNWTPSARTSVNLGYGDRFFGDTQRLSIEHRHRRSQFSLSYNKSLTTSRELREQDVFIPLLDDAGNQQVLGGLPVFLSSTATTLTRSPILEERLQASYSIKGRRTTVGFNVSVSDQSRLEDLLDSRFINYRINADRSLASNLNLNGLINFEEQRADSGSSLGENSDTWRYSLGVTKGLGVNTNLALNLTHTNRNSEDDGETYKENRVTVSLTMNLK